MCSNHGEWAEPDPTTDEIRECHIWQSAYGSDGCHEGQDPHTHRGILLERLEAENVPEWVKITEDESTWPPEKKVLFYSQSHVASDYGRYGLIGDWWRPLTDFDRPPQGG